MTKEEIEMINFTFQAPAALKRRIEEIAKTEDRSLGAQVRVLLAEAIAKAEEVPNP